ncbi:hypothetical protein [Mesobacillus foraminis]|uniref:Uncharacterized protein n=1 Tax=Mesobacillus foraminis TaxID=279826 RepID=A0A4R2B535_9BACI|nr:hypothetical protein [Mesobacillus foraminis]TCN20464.1 hypothetical protein EV146_11483 [Mesobacillus foraminis]
MLVTLIRILFVLSWTTVLFMPNKSIKRFFPVTIGSALLTVTTVLIGTHYHFWEEKGTSKNRMWNHLILVLGPFAVGNMWIFHLTYGNFVLYFLANLINNFSYAFGGMPLLAKAKYLKYVKFTRIHHIMITMFESFILYGYQMLYDKPYSKQK